MSRKKLIRSREFPYHLTARGNNREPFPCGIQFAWKTLVGELLIQQALFGLKVHAFVVMPNHFHLLASSAERDIDKVMRDFLSSSTRIMNHRTNRSGRIFGGPYFWSRIATPIYYAHVLKYVLRNPVKAGLSSTVAEYPFSSYAGLLGNTALPITISEPANHLSSRLETEVESLDQWLNVPHSREMNNAIRKGLRWDEFQIHPDSKTRRKIDHSI